LTLHTCLINVLHLCTVIYYSVSISK